MPEKRVEHMQINVTIKLIAVSIKKTLSRYLKGIFILSIMHIQLELWSIL